MNATTSVFDRVILYSILPLALAVIHVLVDRQALTTARRVEVFLLYVFAIGVGAGGIGGFFGHMFLADEVAKSIGWPTGSPFQQEMAFANLALGVLGFGALRQRDGFRVATVLATAILGIGATIVHVLDIATTGNLAPGNTIQNIGNVLDPLVLVVLLRLAAATPVAEADGSAFVRWQGQQAQVAGASAIGVGAGFGLGFAIGAPLALGLAGAVIGVLLGWTAARGKVAARSRGTSRGKVDDELRRTVEFLNDCTTPAFQIDCAELKYFATESAELLVQTLIGAPKSRPGSWATTQMDRGFISR